uniref:Molybdopterin biosynthesis protein n=1 Tax=Erythroglossum lusitanicum TaxID=2575615 RepID=A0A4D6WT07_9FLOR|nr:Molybdopterin biosynthesis protein [Erythroglossum lusitanicum]
MLNTNINLTYLTKEEYISYSKHITLDNVGLNGQKRLKKAKVLIIGAGGLGCPAILYLVASGIGYIGIADHDTIKLSNLNRQILYNINDENQNKTVCAKKRLINIQPKCKIITHTYKINKKNALELIQYYDIILDASDNFSTRYLIDKICYKLHKIYIYGAIQKFEGQISVFNYKNNNKYSYIYPETLNLLENNCNNYGIMGIVSGHIGIIQATEIIKIILGIGNIANKQLLICNLLNMSLKKIRIHKFKNQLISKNILHNNLFIKKISSKFKIYSLKNFKYKSTLIVDVRSKYEFKEKHINKSINIPLDKLKIKKTLNFIKNYNNKKIIIIYCKEIYRSLIASNILKNYNIDHYLLENIE